MGVELFSYVKTSFCSVGEVSGLLKATGFGSRAHKEANTLSSYSTAVVVFRKESDLFFINTTFLFDFQEKE